MIDYDSSNFFDTLLRLRGSVILQIYRHVICTGMLGLAAAFYDDYSGLDSKFGEDEYFSLSGVTLGFLLVFRSNICYNRYTEGLNVLGAAIRDLRDLVIRAHSILRWVGEKPGMTQEKVDEIVGNYSLKLCRWVALYFALLRAHLRFEEHTFDGNRMPLKKGETFQGENYIPLSSTEVQGLLKSKNKPIIVASWIRNSWSRLFRMGIITDWQRKELTEGAGNMLVAFSSTDKISKVPFPFPFAQMLLAFTFVYCYVCPFLFAMIYGYASPIASMMMTFAMFGINSVGTELEDPFGYDDNDLPIEAMFTNVLHDMDMLLNLRLGDDSELYDDERPLFLRRKNTMLKSGSEYGKKPFSAAASYQRSAAGEVSSQPLLPGSEKSY
eukprot:Rmarinus@m.8